MRRFMRTTLTLEDDVARQIDELRRRRGEGLKETVNRVLRAGIAALTAEPGKAAVAPFRTEPADCGEPRLASLDDIAEVLAFAEGEDFR